MKKSGKHTNKAFIVTRIMAVAVLVILTACSDDKIESVIPPTAVYDIVTLESTGDTGTTFTMQVGGDTPVVTYLAPYDFSQSKQLEEGMRLTICYSPKGGTAPYTSGVIDLYGYSMMSNTEQQLLQGDAAAYDGWKSQPMQLRAMWRTGRYINMQTQLYTLRAIKPERFVMVADATTTSGEYPELHVVYDNAEDNDGMNLYDVNASFDISGVWDAPGTRGVVVYYPTPTGPASMVFEKNDRNRQRDNKPIITNQKPYYNGRTTQTE